jgi:NDP-sugar pyrophosphorylase family protein
MKNNLCALVLCGGKGMRLRPLTNSIPKPLIKIGNKEILDHIISFLLKNFIREIILTIGYQANKIERFLQLNKKNKTSKIYTINSGNVDIVKRIVECQKFIGKKNFILLYGDTISDVNIAALIKSHRYSKKPATVTLYQLKSEFGVMEFDKKQLVKKYSEKPYLNKWINIGYFYFNNEILKIMERFNSFESFLSFLIKKKKLNSFLHKGHHITVNTKKELIEAESNVKLIL